MLLSLKQRYVVDVLDKLGCIRRDQLYILTRDAFKTEEYTLTENQMEAVIKNLPYMVNNIRLDNGCVRYDTATAAVCLLRSAKTHHVPSGIF